MGLAVPCTARSRGIQPVEAGFRCLLRSQLPPKESTWPPDPEGVAGLRQETPSRGTAGSLCGSKDCTPSGAGRSPRALPRASSSATPADGSCIGRRSHAPWRKQQRAGPAASPRFKSFRRANRERLLTLLSDLVPCHRAFRIGLAGNQQLLVGLAELTGAVIDEAATVG